MKKIYNNLDIENLIKTEWFNQFDEKQKIEIKAEIESKIDVFRYAKKEFEALQMRIIRLGLQNNLDISVYEKKEFSWRQMVETGQRS